MAILGTAIGSIVKSVALCTFPSQSGPAFHLPLLTAQDGRDRSIGKYSILTML
jgi:hypothetical protein